MKKKLLALLLTGCLVLSLFAFVSCQGGSGSPAGGTSGVGETSDTGDTSSTGDASGTQPSEGTQAGSGTVQGLRRLKRITMTGTDDDGEKIEGSFDLTWENNGVYISSSEGVSARLLFDSETKSVNYTEGNGLSDYSFIHGFGLLFQYSDGQKIVKLGTNAVDVVYEENKLTVADDIRLELEYDPGARTVRGPLWSGSGMTKFGTVYELDEKDHIIKVTPEAKFVFDTNSGKYIESPSNETLAIILDYDEFGNLVKLQSTGDEVEYEVSAFMSFEYYDEPTEQAWENTVPYVVANLDSSFSVPLLFGLLEQ